MTLDTVHDNYKLHINDTLVAGKYKNTLSAVEKLVKEGPADVLRTKDLGVDYDLNPDGTMCKTLEAGHSRHRIVHHKDSTGKAIVDALIEGRQEPVLRLQLLPARDRRHRQGISIHHKLRYRNGRRNRVRVHARRENP